MLVLLDRWKIRWTNNKSDRFNFYSSQLRKIYNTSIYLSSLSCPTNLFIRNRYCLFLVHTILYNQESNKNTRDLSILRIVPKFHRETPPSPLNLYVYQERSAWRFTSCIRKWNKTEEFTTPFQVNVGRGGEGRGGEGKFEKNWSKKHKLGNAILGVGDLSTRAKSRE